MKAVRKGILRGERLDFDSSHLQPRRELSKHEKQYGIPSTLIQIKGDQSRVSHFVCPALVVRGFLTSISKLKHKQSRFLLPFVPFILFQSSSHLPDAVHAQYGRSRACPCFAVALLSLLFPLPSFVTSAAQRLTISLPSQLPTSSHLTTLNQSHTTVPLSPQTDHSPLPQP